METLSQLHAVETANEKYTMKGEVMNKEWERFQSYANFPVDSSVSAIRLARAGFYYTGKGEEVVCFCCGLRQGVWTEDETVLEVHKRLSPHCRFICGEETTNIAINGENTLKNVASSLKVSKLTKDYERAQTKTSCGQSIQKADENINAQVSQPSKKSTDETLTNTSDCHHDSRAPDLRMVTNGQIELYPGVTDAKPKHPDYALMSTRQRSFYNWPEDHHIDPAVLSKAGFFFAGMGDCVRCFFCGGGMKNWQSDDNPWIEHARWFSQCEYVKLCKGNNFANLCNAAHLSINVEFNESQFQVDNIPDDQKIQDINSVAAKLVLAKGYTQRDVENGIKFARQKYSSSALKVQYLIEYLQGANKDVPEIQQSACRTREVSEHLGNIANGDTSATSQNAISGEPRIEKITKTKSEKQNLLEENRRLRDLMTCKICLDKDAVVAFLPCGHLTSCEDCAKSLRKCAICRKPIAGSVRVYQA